MARNTSNSKIRPPHYSFTQLKELSFQAAVALFPTIAQQKPAPFTPQASYAENLELFYAQQQKDQQLQKQAIKTLKRKEVLSSLNLKAEQISNGQTRELLKYVQEDLHLLLEAEAQANFVGPPALPTLENAPASFLGHKIIQEYTEQLRLDIYALQLTYPKIVNYLNYRLEELLLPHELQEQRLAELHTYFQEQIDHKVKRMSILRAFMPIITSKGNQNKPQLIIERIFALQDLLALKLKALEQQYQRSQQVLALHNWQVFNLKAQLLASHQQLGYLQRTLSSQRYPQTQLIQALKQQQQTSKQLETQLAQALYQSQLLSQGKKQLEVALAHVQQQVAEPRIVDLFELPLLHPLFALITDPQRSLEEKWAIIASELVAPSVPQLDGHLEPIFDPFVQFDDPEYFSRLILTPEHLKQLGTKSPSSLEHIQEALLSLQQAIPLQEPRFLNRGAVTSSSLETNTLILEQDKLVLNQQLLGSVPSYQHIFSLQKYGIDLSQMPEVVPQVFTPEYQQSYLEKLQLAQAQTQKHPKTLASPRRLMTAEEVASNDAQKITLTQPQVPSAYEQNQQLQAQVMRKLHNYEQQGDYQGAFTYLLKQTKEHQPTWAHLQLTNDSFGLGNSFSFLPLAPTPLYHLGLSQQLSRGANNSFAFYQRLAPLLQQLHLSYNKINPQRDYWYSLTPSQILLQLETKIWQPQVLQAELTLDPYLQARGEDTPRVEFKRQANPQIQEKFLLAPQTLERVRNRDLRVYSKVFWSNHLHYKFVAQKLASQGKLLATDYADLSQGHLQSTGFVNYLHLYELLAQGLASTTKNTGEAQAQAPQKLPRKLFGKDLALPLESEIRVNKDKINPKPQALAKTQASTIALASSKTLTPLSSKEQRYQSYVLQQQEHVRELLLSKQNLTPLSKKFLQSEQRQQERKRQTQLEKRDFFAQRAYLPQHQQQLEQQIQYQSAHKQNLTLLSLSQSSNSKLSPNREARTKKLNLNQEKITRHNQQNSLLETTFKANSRISFSASLKKYLTPANPKELTSILMASEAPTSILECDLEDYLLRINFASHSGQQLFTLKNTPEQWLFYSPYTDTAVLRASYNPSYNLALMNLAYTQSRLALTPKSKEFYLSYYYSFYKGFSDFALEQKQRALELIPTNLGQYLIYLYPELHPGYHRYSQQKIQHLARVETLSKNYNLSAQAQFKQIFTPVTHDNLAFTSLMATHELFNCQALVNLSKLELTTYRQDLLYGYLGNLMTRTPMSVVPQKQGVNLLYSSLDLSTSNSSQEQKLTATQVWVTSRGYGIKRTPQGVLELPLATQELVPWRLLSKQAPLKWQQAQARLDLAVTEANFAHQLQSQAQQYYQEYVAYQQIYNFPTLLKRTTRYPHYVPVNYYPHLYAQSSTPAGNRDIVYPLYGQATTNPLTGEIWIEGEPNFYLPSIPETIATPLRRSLVYNIFAEIEHQVAPGMRFAPMYHQGNDMFFKDYPQELEMSLTPEQYLAYYYAWQKEVHNYHAEIIALLNQRYFKKDHLLHKDITYANYEMRPLGVYNRQQLEHLALMSIPEFLEEMKMHHLLPNIRQALASKSQLYLPDMHVETLSKLDLDRLTPTFERVILHCDMNNCFASITMQENPLLKNHAVIIAGDPEERKGIVVAASYEAKAFGVRTTEPLVQALKKCPGAIVVAPNFADYQRYSRLANLIYRSYTPLVEQFSIDEVWMDVTEIVQKYDSPVALATQIKEHIKRELGITISVGVSFNKTFAKLGSDLKKPDAVTYITPHNYREIVWNRPVNELIGVGSATLSKLQALGIRQIGDLALTARETLHQELGWHGVNLWLDANGLDFVAVKAGDAYDETKSIGRGTTLKTDAYKVADFVSTLEYLSNLVSEALAQKNLLAAGIQISVKDNTFKSFSWQEQLELPTLVAADLLHKGLELFNKHYSWLHPVRAITIRVFNLTPYTREFPATWYQDFSAHIRKNEQQRAIHEVNAQLVDEDRDLILAHSKDFTYFSEIPWSTLVKNLSENL
ncbi:DNA polymerase Y family protein [Psittacicella gerlachiana]|uniref:DNA polymerase IV n=1 Tax=Psittacicella gerlachiana TaxID=2028574 RepID=A0A3A1YES7_9GAMM|nr:DNA polymerase IV [Psittacicella gerlachiana]RIY36185.1 hypothetical protein CKF59_02905 [Psittacicella gerlachiana]